VPAPSSDFLEPSLDAKDDFVGFNKPFQPQWVAFVGFLGGPLVAAVLLGLNHVKLGGSRWIGLAWFLGCALVVFPLRILAGVWGQVLLASLMVGSVLLYRRRYRMFELSGGEERVNWWLGIAIIIAGRFLTKAAIVVTVIAMFLVLGEETTHDLFGWFGIDLSAADGELGSEAGDAPAAPEADEPAAPDTNGSDPAPADLGEAEE
jgi:hypothetical protein